MSSAATLSDEGNAFPYRFWEVRFAFLLCAGAFVWHLLDLLYDLPLETSGLAITLYILPIAAALCIAAAFKGLRDGPHGILLVSAAFIAGTLISDLAASPRLLHLLVILAAVFLMLTFLRIGAIWYALLAVACGVTIGWSTGDVSIGFGSAACFGGLFFVTNYLVQLILDHRHERQRFIRYREQLDMRRVLKLTLAFWAPSAVLVGVGVWINWLIQDQITKATYVAGIVQEAPPGYKDRSGRTGIERDVYYTINTREERSTKEFSENLKAWAAKSDVKLVEFPKFVSTEFEKLRPPATLMRLAPVLALSFHLGPRENGSR